MKKKKSTAKPLEPNPGFPQFGSQGLEYLR